MVQLDLTSKEFIMNEKIRLNTRFDGKISDHIRNILTIKLSWQLKKIVDIEETSNNITLLEITGNHCYAMNWLSKKAVSAIFHKSKTWKYCWIFFL
jgi:hypothetical protein